MISSRNLVFTLVCLTVLCLLLFVIQPSEAANASTIDGLWVMLFVLAKIVAGIVSCVFFLALFCARPWRVLLEKTPKRHNTAAHSALTNKAIKEPLVFQK